ncbi:cytochrome c oxidase assembly protein [Rhodococcus sp. X156]|uniref:cytochrome c oxidase assembly protein n=1 Tax=Rhodococcus sp. X156 TaxID=2499145 RepID=UPI0019D0445F|nr:cytochrome c oxidase assembly protein [Rhodococcus sp. X156]
MLAHDAHTHATGTGASPVVLAVLGLFAAAYLVGALRTDRDGRGWQHWRTAAFLGGLALLGWALVPDALPLPAGTFQAHMAQHLLLAMLAPLGLVLGAPVTLVLRNVSATTGRRLVAVLRSRPVGLVANPVVALLLTLGSLYLLYLTPLYAWSSSHPLAHHLLHLHFLLAGYLFAWVIAGPDPGPHRLSVRARLVVLGVAIAGHAILSQLMYANRYVRIPTTSDDLQAGASLMYFGGDIAELLLALAMLLTWRVPRRARATTAVSAP